MTPTALNHMTMPHASTLALLDAAAALGCVGVELRNDLKTTIFNGASPSDIRDAAKARGLRILALAEVYGFNDNTAETQANVRSLVRLAQDCEAENIVLIPRIATGPVARPDQRDGLRAALTAIQPMLQDTGVTALIECLGFPNSSLRMKSDAVAVLDDLGQPDCFALIHDTFHHSLAGEDALFANLTRIAHISGVAATDVALPDMTDAHRGLVDAADRLGNLNQITALKAQGYTGAFSIEAFAPEVHALKTPTQAMSDMFAFINAGSAKMVA